MYSTKRDWRRTWSGCNLFIHFRPPYDGGLRICNDRAFQKGDAMIRKAFVMHVDPDRHQEYEDRHNPIWPELAVVLEAHGVHNYSIFLEAETSHLFAYVEVEDEARWEAIAATPVCKKWWGYMADIMSTNPDQSPRSTELREVFHLD